MTTKRNARRPAAQTKRAEESSISRVEQAYDYIRQAIQNHRLKPGDRLREAELAEAIGVSRTPLREALARLESDGLIVNDPARGLAVMQLDYNMVGELYFIREVLEGTAARLAAQHASEVELAIIDEICDQYRRAMGDGPALAVRNRQFHEALYRCAHNRYLVKMLNGLHDALALLGDSMLLDAKRAEQTLQEHAEIVDAIKARNPDAADLATRKHIRTAQVARLKRRFDGG